jgi:uncharacterized Zn-finger protein
MVKPATSVPIVISVSKSNHLCWITSERTQVSIWKKKPNLYSKLALKFPYFFLQKKKGEKPFSCETCGMAFPKKSALNDHSWTHKSVKRYNCELCKRGFSRKEFLRNHSCQARQIPTANLLLPQPVTAAPSFAIKYEPATLSLLNLNP